MKKILLIVLVSLSFGIVKAHFIPENYKTLKPAMKVIPINALTDYNILFKVNPYCNFPYWRMKLLPSKQNKLAASVPSTTLRHHKAKMKQTGD